MTQYSFLSETAVSCLFTKSIASQTDIRQCVQDSYCMPGQDTRLLCAQLLLEEALETIGALGFVLCPKGQQKNQEMTIGGSESFRFLPTYPETLECVVDGCLDTCYVATGVLMACGVPDIPHMREVCSANDRKFPGGVATINPETGKYLKPPGWIPPQFEEIKRYVQKQAFSMKAESERVVAEKAK